MLKFLFWLLLAANGVLFALHQGYLGGGDASRREPARLARQLNPDKLTLIDESRARAAAAPLFAAPAAEAAPAATSAPAPEAAAPTADSATAPPAAMPSATPPATSAVTACVEIGDFGAADGQRFAARLDELGLRAQAGTRQVGDGAEAASYMVYLAPPPDHAALEAKLAELRQQGVRDFYVLPPSAAPAGAISLGVFKSEEAARTQLAGVQKKGVRGARIQARGARQAYQLRALQPTQQAAFDTLRGEFPAQQTRACAAD